MKSARAKGKPNRFRKIYKRKKGPGYSTGMKALAGPRADFSRYQGDAIAALAISGLFKSLFKGDK